MFVQYVFCFCLVGNVVVVVVKVYKRSVGIEVVVICYWYIQKCINCKVGYVFVFVCCFIEYIIGVGKKVGV